MYLTRKGADYFKHLLEFQNRVKLLSGKGHIRGKSQNQVTEQQNILLRRSYTVGEKLKMPAHSE